MNPDLADYVADKTFFALFDRIGVEEANIRNNPAARTSDLLKKFLVGNKLKIKKIIFCKNLTYNRGFKLWVEFLNLLIKDNEGIRYRKQKSFAEFAKLY